MTKPQPRRISLVVNGEPREGHVEPRMTLGDFLRQDLRLTGTHLGCEHGVCGACTILLDGSPARACLTLAVQADGAEVTTVEGLSPEQGLSDLQAQMSAAHALQCGYCTPGFVVVAEAFLKENPDPTPDQVRDALSGNLCRCTGYLPIVEAVLATARERNAGGHAGRHAMKGTA